jgi:hypothetical protein
VPLITVSSEKKSADLFRKLMNHVKTSFKLNENGQPSAESFNFRDTTALMGLCVKRNDNVADHHFSKAIIVAIQKGLEKNDFSSKAFELSCNQFLQELIKTKKQRYAMWTGLNLKSDIETKTISITLDSVRIFIGAKLPSKLNDSALDELVLSSVHDQPKTQSFVWGYTNAIDQLSAGKATTSAIDLLAALVNFQSQLGRGFNLLPPPALKPEAIFVSGPNYFLRNSKDDEWSPTIWMSEHHNPKLWERTSSKLELLSPAMPAIRKHYKALVKSPFQSRLRRTLLNLNGSWNAPTKQERATNLWMAIESLFSDKSEKCDQETIVRRATRSEEPEKRWISRERFNFINRMRNSAVHSFAEINDNDRFEHILQYVHKMVIGSYLELLNIDNKKIRNDGEYIDWLGLSSDADVLLRKKRILEFALQSQ